MANRPSAGRLSRAQRLDETRRLRSQGLTYREIAERLDVSVSTVANDLRAARTEASASARSSEDDGQAARRQSNGKAGRLLELVRAARQRLP